MRSSYHKGEREVQKRAGVETMARRVAGGIHDVIPEAAQEFLETQPMAILSSIAPNGSVWASVLAGKPGFLLAPDEKTVRIDAVPHPADPLADNLQHRTENPLAKPELGMVVIELETRKRIRINGEAELNQDGTIRLHAREVYGNCPKYIQAREIAAVASDEEAPAPDMQRGTALTEPQQAWIAKADTFFIASAAPDGRADASHRGGNPGFVRVLNASTLEFPDYTGNMMFNTLGNITANPNAGLLFLDFETGNTLQLSGKAQVIWDAERAHRFAGAQRVVEFHIEQVIEIAHANPLRFRFLQYSRFNPI